MATANEEYLDASIRHQIGLRRYTAGLTKRVARLLELADRDLTERLRLRLKRFEGKDVDFTSEQWRALLTDIREARKVALQQYKDMTRGELSALGVLEAEREISLLTAAIPVEISFATVTADQLRAIATSRPFQGRHLRDWYQTLEQGDQRRLTQALQLGMAQGETTDDIVRRVVGTRRAQYSDGILAVTRRDAQAIVRTATNHVSNVARASIWEANSDIVAARIWVSTLDGRTSAICRARDGQGRPIGGRTTLPEGVIPLKPLDATPPAHINCRSTMVGYIDGVGLVGKRPTVTDTRTRAKREVDFRAEARRRGVPIQQVRREWAAENIGQVPSKTTYQEFLTRQPAKFQDEVLGPTRGKLFRAGGMRVNEFVDRAGNELTLDQLANTRPEAFVRAGLNPEDF